MANGRNPEEAKRRLRVDRPKLSSKEPIAAIEKRVIDSDALADCRPSSVVVLLLFARNLAKGMNGHTFVSQEDAARHGVEKKTFYRALKELAAHGFIFQTIRGGHGLCARYALTWLPLTRETKGLHLGNFRACAWRNWTPDARKNRGGKMSPSSGQKSPQPVTLVGKKPLSLGDKNPPVEVNTTTHSESTPFDPDPGSPALKGGKEEGAPHEKAARRNEVKKNDAPDNPQAPWLLDPHVRARRLRHAQPALEELRPC